MNIIDLQEDLKDVSDDGLMEAFQSGSTPQFLVLSEFQRRKRMRDDFKRQEASNMSTVAEEMITGAGVSQEGLTAVAGAMAPKTNVAQDTGLAQAVPMQATRAPQPQMAADGGTLKMAEGGIAALLDGVFGFGRGNKDIGKPVQPYPDNSPNPRDRSTWMRMYGETHNLDGSPKTMSPNISEIDKPTDYKSPFVSDVSADIGDFTPNPISSEIDQLINQRESANLNNISRVGSLPFLPPVTDNSFSELPIRGADTDPAQQLAKFLASRRSDIPGANLPGESNPYIIDPDAASEAGQAILDSELKDPSSPTNPTIGSYGRTTVGQTKDEIKRMNEILDTAGIGPDTATGGVDMLDLMLQAQTERGGYEAADQYSKDELMQYLINQKPRFQGGAVPGGSFPTGAMYNPTVPGAFPNDAELAGQYPSGGSETITERQRRKGQEFADSYRLPPPLREFIDTFKSEPDASDSSYPELPIPASDVEAPTSAAEALQDQEDKIASKADEYRGDDPIAILDSVTDGGAGGAGFGSAESEIAKMISDRRKRADQNKWLALAEAGFAMMGPAATLGEGISRGGRAGLKAMRDSQKGMDAFETDMFKLQAQLDIAQQRSADTRYGADTRAGTSRYTADKGFAATELSTEARNLATKQRLNAATGNQLKDMIDIYDSQLAELGIIPGAEIPPEKMDAYNDITSQKQATINELQKRTGLDVAATGGPELSGQFNVT